MSDKEVAAKPLAYLTRNEIIESIHFGHLVTVSSAGDIETQVGNAQQIIYPRSSVKGIQAAAMVRAGLKLEPELLALVASSHSGSKLHIDSVLKILATYEIKPDKLQNSVDKPLGLAERKNWGDNPGTKLAMNCSGKHAGMLATSVINGWDTQTYLEPAHPLQIAIKNEYELLGVDVKSQTFDGCGAPLIALEINQLARAFNKMNLSPDKVYKEVLNASRDFPNMVAGEKRLVTNFMQKFPNLYLKDGVEGVLVASLNDGRSAAIKISDGSNRAQAIILMRVLENWGLDCKSFATEYEYSVYGGKNKVGALITAF